MLRWPNVIALVIALLVIPPVVMHLCPGLSAHPSFLAHAEAPASANPDDAEGSEDASAPGDSGASEAAATPPAPPVHSEGDYGGVVPDRLAPPPTSHDAAATKPRARPAKPTVTWLGFQPLPGGASRVFVQLSTQATYSQSVVPVVPSGTDDVLVVLIPDVRLGATNQTRPLNTTYFATPLARVVARRVSAKGRGKKRTPGGVALTLSFKDKSQVRAADAHLETAPGGYVYLYLDFGPAKLIDVKSP